MKLSSTLSSLLIFLTINPSLLAPDIDEDEDTVETQMQLLHGSQNNGSENIPTTPVDFEKEFFEGMHTFGQVGKMVKDRHYSFQHTQQALIESINCFLSTLDPHSSYLDPKTYKSMLESTSGEFYGIGIVIDNTRKQKDKFLTIIDTVPGGPADKAGIKPHDKIMEIDGHRLEGMSTEEATSKIKGERHSIVRIKILREKQKDLLSFEIKRDIVKEQASLSFHLTDYDIHYLSLTTFTANAIKQIEKLLKQAKKKKYKGLILDLRNNSGGLLNAAIDIAGLFLPSSSLVVTTKDRQNNVTEQYRTSKKPIADSSIPIFIMINNYTASAAEILAGALKVHSDMLAEKSPTHQQNQKELMVFLVGTKTFGKGSVQEVIPIGNNSAIKLTTSLYYLPNDITIQGTGIEPDFTVENMLPPTEQMQWFTKYYGREQTLTHYIKPANSGDGDKKNGEEKNEEENRQRLWSDRAKQMLQKDNQLRETISLVNQLHTFQSSCPKNVYNRRQAIAFLKQNHLTNETITIQEIKM